MHTYGIIYWHVFIFTPNKNEALIHFHFYITVNQKYLRVEMFTTKQCWLIFFAKQDKYLLPDIHRKIICSIISSPMKGHRKMCNNNFNGRNNFWLAANIHTHKDYHVYNYCCCFLFFVFCFYLFPYLFFQLSWSIEQILNLLFSINFSHTSFKQHAH